MLPLQHQIRKPPLLKILNRFNPNMPIYESWK